MADKFGDLVTELKEETHIPDETGLRRHLENALKHYRSKRFLFSEATATFNLTVNQGTYGVEHGLPGDIMSIDAITLNRSGAFYPLDNDPISIQEMRLYQSHVNILGYPIKWCWYNQELIFFPKPSSTYEMQVDYRRDPTRDDTTGVKITRATTSDDFSNELIRRGAELLIARAGFTYYDLKAKSPKDAGAYKLAEKDALSSIIKERDVMKLGGTQASWHL